MRFSFFQVDAARARKGDAVARTRDFFLRFTSLLLAEKEVRLQSVHKDRHFDQSSCHLFDKVSSLRYFCKVAMTVVSNERTSLLFAALPSCEDAATSIQLVREVAFDLMVPLLFRFSRTPWLSKFSSPRCYFDACLFLGCVLYLLCSCLLLLLLHIFLILPSSFAWCR